MSMIIPLGTIYTWLAAFGRRWGSKTVTYRLLDSELTVISDWTSAGIQDLTKGRYGIILPMDNASVCYIQFYLLERDQYKVYPVNISNTAGLQTYVANFIATDRTVTYRILDADQVELEGWTSSGVKEILPKAGYYGITRAFTTDMRYIQWYDGVSLYLTDGINFLTATIVSEINTSTLLDSDPELSLQLDDKSVITALDGQLASAVTLDNVNLTVELMDESIAPEV